MTHATTHVVVVDCECKSTSVVIALGFLERLADAPEVRVVVSALEPVFTNY